MQHLPQFSWRRTLIGGTVWPLDYVLMDAGITVGRIHYTEHAPSASKWAWSLMYTGLSNYHVKHRCHGRALTKQDAADTTKQCYLDYVARQLALGLEVWTPEYLKMYRNR